MDLVVNKVRQFEHVDVTDGDFLFERVTAQAIVKHCLSRFIYDLRQAKLASATSRVLQFLLDLVFGRAVEYWRGEVQTKHSCRPAEVGLQNLTHVHSRGNA